MALSENPTLEEIVDEVERLNNLIVNRGGAQTITPSTSNKTLNKGYYKGNITIKGDSNLIASNIISGKSIFGVSGKATVSSLGGKKWASGTGVASTSGGTFTYSGTTVTISRAYIDIKLDFTPSVVLVSSKADGYEYLSVLNNMGFVFNKSNVKMSIYGSNAYSSSTLNLKNDSYVSLGNNVYRIPVHKTLLTNTTWVAYE